MTEELSVTTKNLVELARQIVRHMDGWMLCPLRNTRQMCVELRRHDEADPEIGIRIRYTAGTARIAVTGMYPHPFYPDTDEAPRITCSALRDPETLVRDIERRLLPQYYDALEESLRRRYNKRLHDKAQREALEQLAMRLGVDVKENHVGELAVYHAGTDGQRYKLRVLTGWGDAAYEDITVNMELGRVSLDQALQICAILR